MIHHQDSRVTLHHANCLDVLTAMPDNSVDSIVTDPPYGLSNTDPKHVTEAIGRWVNGERDYVPGGAGFMGKAWDAFVPPPAVWDECLRVLKPGGHALVFSSSRTTDLMTLSLRLAGFEIRDSIAWLYGGAMAPATDAARQWQGWGTGLRPSMELICVARKPIPGTVAACIQEWGTGAINIDACRIGYQSDADKNSAKPQGQATSGALLGKAQTGISRKVFTPNQSDAGRWPPNVVLDDDTATQLDRETGERPTGTGLISRKWRTSGSMAGALGDYSSIGYEDTGGPSRFFPVMKYQAKAPQRERPSYTDETGRKIAHPTVKPLTLARWLVKLVTQPDGTVLDPFAGSGTTIEAAMMEGFRVIGVEQDASYLPLIVTRIE